MSTSPINDVKGPVRKSGDHKAAVGKCPKITHKVPARKKRSYRPGY